MNAPLPITATFDLQAHFGAFRCRFDVTNEEYHRDRSCVSASGLKQILRSPAHFQAYLNGDMSNQTPAKRLGTAIHTRLLEPQVFASDYVRAPVGDRRSKEYKEFEIANDGSIILTPDQWTTVEGIDQSVAGHASAQAMLRSGLTEHTLIWQDKNTGIWLKIRPDCICPDVDTGICLDVKSTEDAAPIPFARSCVTYDYDLQAAMYLEGLRENFGRDFDFCFLATEKQAPFAVALYGAPEEMLARGRRRFREALSLLASCRDRNEWPSYQPAGDYELLEWPRWAK